MISYNEAVVGEHQSRVRPRSSGRQDPNLSEEYVGDSCEVKKENCFRIMTQNLNGIGQNRGNVKEKAAKEFIHTFHIDILVLQQLDGSWDKVQNVNKIRDRFRGWKESYNLSVVYNTEDVNRKAIHPGGTAVVAVGNVTHHWGSLGFDSKKLSRWSWTQFQGSYGKYLRVVSVYRPCSTDNTNSAYMTHYRYSLRYREGKCPRELLLIDLLHDIKCWKEKGDSIIITGDFNEDI